MKLKSNYFIYVTEVDEGIPIEWLWEEWLHGMIDWYVLNKKYKVVVKEGLNKNGIIITDVKQLQKWL